MAKQNKKMISHFGGKKVEAVPGEFSGVVRFIPLIVTGGFFLCTILLLIWGPMDWHISNPQKLYPFLISCAVALTVGYLLAIYKGKTSGKPTSINVNHILLVGIIVSLVLYIPSCYYNTGKWYPDVYLGITNSGIAYQNAKYYSENGVKWLFYIRILLSPFTMLVTPIVLFCSDRLSKKLWYLGIFVILLNVALGIAEGVNKQVADITMQMVVALCILLFTKQKGRTTKKAIAWGKCRIILAMLLICCSFFLYYMNTMSGRIATDAVIEQAGDTDISEIIDKMQEEDSELEIDVDVNESMQSYATFSVATPKEGTFWDTMLPSKVQSATSFLTSYFCHGYHGLSLAMDEPFTSTYGLGFSQFLRHNVLKAIGKSGIEDSIVAQTYMGKIEKYGWETGAVWSTFFIFPASDISFPGTVLLVLVIGFLLGLSWKDVVVTGDPFAAVTFMGFVTMVFYFSANNQMFQTGEACIGFLVSIAVWCVCRRIGKRRK